MKILKCVLILIIAVLALCFTSCFADIYCNHVDADGDIVCDKCREAYSEGFTYELNDEGCYSVTSARGMTASEVVIPETHKGIPVTRIEDNVFYYYYGLARVTIPATVTSIGKNAFYGCGDLTNISVDPENPIYTDIDGSLYTKDGKDLVLYATGKKEESFTVPDSVTRIFEGAFRHCNRIKSIVIPDSVISIGKDAFSECLNLTSITLGAGVTDIEYGALNGPANLTDISVSPDNQDFKDIDGVLYTKDGVALVKYPRKKEGESFVIPWGVKIIREFAFCQCDNLDSICIPSSVTEIYDYAFFCSEIADVDIGGGVVNIGDKAFAGCENICGISLPDSLTSIGADAFRGCRNLAEILLPSGVTSIGGGAFEYCYSLTEIVIPNGVKYIGEKTFNNCTALKSVVIGDGVVSIGWEAFGNCESLSSVVMGSGVKVIDRCAFLSCYSLSSIVIGENVTSIGAYAFLECTSLVEVINKSSLDIEAGDYGHGEVAHNALEVHSGESKLVNRDGYIFYTVDDNIYLIGYVGDDTELVLPYSYDYARYSIYKFAFDNRDDIVSVVIPTAVIAIGEGAFTNSGISEIKYSGSESEWNQIAKHQKWDHLAGKYTLTYNKVDPD